MKEIDFYSNKIDILCLQEVKLESGFCENSLSIRGFDLLIEKNSIKARSAVYISNRVNYCCKNTNLKKNMVKPIVF